MRTLAHFRPIEDNEKSKDVNGPEPLNSRSNKLHCKEHPFCGLAYFLLSPIISVLVYSFNIYKSSPWGQAELEFPVYLFLPMRLWTGYLRSLG